MAEHLIARRPFAYPVGAGLALVRQAGGLSKLTEAQLQTVQFRYVMPGECCDDMPVESQALRLARGEIAWVERPDVAAAAAGEE